MGVAVKIFPPDHEGNVLVRFYRGETYFIGRKLARVLTPELGEVLRAVARYEINRELDEWNNEPPVLGG